MARTYRVVVGCDDAGLDYKERIKATWRPTTG